MATDLRQRATDQQARFDGLLATMRTGLHQARTELDRRAPDPTGVAAED